MSRENSQDYPPRDNDAPTDDDAEQPVPSWSASRPVVVQLYLTKLKVSLVAAILAAVNKSLHQPEASTKNPAKRTADSEPNKGGKK